MVSPLTAPEAYPVPNFSSHWILTLSPPLPVTDPVPIIVAALTLDTSVMLASRAQAMSLFVFVRIKYKGYE